MATFVLVHGGWAGGWQWKEVASLLRATGHEVYTPTLTGLGERAHLARPDVDLNTHIKDILAVLEYEDLHEVILVGYSYSGIVTTGVADKAPERLAQLIYIDSFIPEDGQSFSDIMGPELTAILEEAARTYGGGWLVPNPQPQDPRDVPHPLKTGLQPVTVRNAAAAALPRTYVYCTGDKQEILQPFVLIISWQAEKAKALGWRYVEINTGHIPMMTAPQELTRLLIELVH